MARVKDLWMSEVKTKDADGNTVIEKRKTRKHPDSGGNKDAKRWLACWFDPDGNEKTKAFAKKTDGENYAKKMESDAARGDYIDPTAGDEKFGDLANKYLRLRAVGGTSREKYRQVYRNQVESKFAHRKVKSVRPSEVLEWLRSAEISRLSASVQGIAYMIVAGVFDLAVADGLRRDNPARNKIVPTPPKGDPVHRDPWSSEQVRLVCAAHPARYRPIPECEAGLGLRQGEVLALAEDDFDFDAMKVHIRRQIVRFGRTWVFKLPKEGKDRWVPLSRGVAAIAQAHIANQPPMPYELPWLNESGEVAKDPHVCKLLFRWVSDDHRTNGKHIKNIRYDQSVWLPALAAVGIIAPPAPGSNGLRFEGGSEGNGTHALRRFFATTLQDAGVSLSGVMEFMGHSKKGQPVTLSAYVQVTDETFEQARQAIDRRLFGLRPVPSQGQRQRPRRAPSRPGRSVGDGPVRAVGEP